MRNSPPPPNTPDASGSESRIFPSILAHGTRLLALSALVLAAVGDARADNYLPSGSPVKVSNVTTGSSYTHTEGPIYDGNGGVLFGELNSTHANNLIWRYDINGATPNATQVVSNSGGMQGAYRYDATRLVTADRDTRQISIRLFSNLNTITTSISAIAGSTFRFNGPNDIVVDLAGGIYFTDPNFENFTNRPGVDGVYYIAPGGSTAQRVISFGTTERPNGIALSPDQHTLYVGLWATNSIYKFTLDAAGSPTNGQSFASVTSPDGMTVDPWGNLIVGRSNGITCWSPAGTSLFSLTTNTSVTNVELGGADGESLFYTTYGTSMGLYKIALTQVPEPTSLSLLALSLGGMLTIFGQRRRVTR
jgi:gluconolactonase